MGLAACSVDLGVIEDVGYFTTNESLSRRYAPVGWGGINEALLHKILRFSIVQQTGPPISPDSTIQMITGIPVPLKPESPLQPFHRFSALRPTDGFLSDNAEDDQGKHLAMLKKAGQAKGAEGIDRFTLLASTMEVVNAVLMRSLGMKDPLEVNRPLAAYGIDSLVAVELRNCTRSELKVELSALDIVGAKTLMALCEVILKRLMA